MRSMKDGHTYGEYWTRTGFQNFVMSQIMLIVPAPKIRFPMSTEKIYTLKRFMWKQSSIVTLKQTSCYTVKLSHSTEETRETLFRMRGTLNILFHHRNKRRSFVLQQTRNIVCLHCAVPQGLHSQLDWELYFCALMSFNVAMVVQGVWFLSASVH